MLCICICHVISDWVSSGVITKANLSSFSLAEAWRSLSGPSRCGQTHELQCKCFFFCPFLIVILLHKFLGLAKLPEWSWTVMLWARSVFSVLDRLSCIQWKWNSAKAASLQLHICKGLLSKQCCSWSGKETRSLSTLPFLKLYINPFWHVGTVDLLIPVQLLAFLSLCALVENLEAIFSNTPLNLQ